MPHNENSITHFWQELKRRKVLRVLAMYAATAFIVLEVGDIVLPRLGFPDWTVTLLIIVIIVGFPVTAVISWIYDITPDGLIKTESAVAEEKKKSSRQSDRRVVNANNIVILILFAAVCILLYPRIFRQDIAADTHGSDGKSIDFIAVLPFSNTKADPETDYLGFAIADQIIGSLSYLNNITVRPSGSVRKYEKRVIDPIIAGDSLNVDYVLIGYYLKEGNMIRLNVELIDVSNNEMIWREPIEVDFNSTFELQDIVAKKVVDGLHIQFSQKELNRIGKDIPDDPLAYEYYLRSISYPFNNEGDRMALEMLNKSIELDSTFAPSYAQLADRLHRLAQYGMLGPVESKRSESLYLKAISLNEDLIFALANLAGIYTETARIDKAVQLTRKILKINPNNSEAHFSLGYIYRYAGMNHEAVREMEKAMAIDPKNPGFRSIVVTYQYAGEYEKSYEASKLYGQSSFIIGEQGATFLRQGNPKQAIECFNRSLDMDPEGLQALWVTGLKASITGEIEAGLDAARRFEEVNLIDAEAWYHFAGNYGLLGDKEGSIRCLRRAVDGGFFNYPFMQTDFFLDAVREETEFQQILLEAKEKHEAFRKSFF
ncbi:MAG: tetratricopeptide repeat protein [Bacteroidota bacterium]